MFCQPKNFPNPVGRKATTSFASSQSSKYAQHGQSIKINIGKPIDKLITIDKADLSIIDCIDQSIKIDTHTVLGLNCYRFYQFYRFYQPQGWLVFTHWQVKR